MPRLVDIATAPPPHVIDQSMAAELAHGILGGEYKAFARLFANTGIRTRHLCRPPEWFVTERSLGEKNAAYIEAATELCARAGSNLLERCGLAPRVIDRIIYVNTTGLATPSIDARLINVLGLRRDVQRTPIWGLGCAGGAAGLSHACTHLRGHPSERVLLIAAEMCSLTFLSDDRSQSNVVASALFADGAAAALLSGDETGDAGYEIVGSRSTLYPDSLDVMGWNVVARGLQVVFDRRIPDIVDAHALGELESFLDAHGLSRSDVEQHLFHPGGPKVLAAYARAFALELDAFRWSREVLREHGNMSSVTVLYVLERYLRAHAPGLLGYGVISALGPGFSSEMLLMKL